MIWRGKKGGRGNEETTTSVKISRADKGDKPRVAPFDSRDRHAAFLFPLSY